MATSNELKAPDSSGKGLNVTEMKMDDLPRLLSQVLGRAEG